MSGVANCTSSLFIFLVVKTYPALADAVTMAGTYWIYSGAAALAVAFILVFIPETKDKRLDQISDGFAKKSRARKEVDKGGEEKEEDEEVKLRGGNEGEERC